jgi:hypothetical protein
MTIDEAIEALTHPVYRIGLVPDQEFIKALKLGIEALKLVQQQSPSRALSGTERLPGETEK